MLADLNREECEITRALGGGNLHRVETELQSLKQQLEKFNEEETKILRALSSHDARSSQSASQSPAKVSHPYQYSTLSSSQQKTVRQLQEQYMSCRKPALSPVYEEVGRQAYNSSKKIVPQHRFTKMYYAEKHSSA